ncbi:hypothetical protein Tco_1412974, partial [Tanacetum coccineum]
FLRPLSKKPREDSKEMRRDQPCIELGEMPLHVLTIVGPIQNYHFHKSLCLTVSLHKARYKATADKLTKAEIRDLFPEEQLMTISDKGDESWYADYANYLSSRVLPFHVSLEMRQPKSFSNVITVHQEGIMVSLQLQEKFSKPDSTGLVFSTTHEDWSELVTPANELATFLYGTRHPKSTSRFLKINELDKLRLEAYESSISYKERTKRWHDKRIKTPTKYEKGDKVLLFNSCMRLFPGKLKSRWYRPFVVSKDMENEAIELFDEDGNEFNVNKQRVKPY